MSNPVRGCGTKKRGGYYLESGFSDTGVLSPWTWALGTHLFDAFNNLSFGNVYTMLPVRGISVVDIPATLVTGNIVPAPHGSLVMEPYQKDLYVELMEKFGNVGLADLVGAAYYTPYSFAMETIKHGPSRRVPERIAKSLVEQLPLPILFAHRKMFLFSTVTAKDIAVLSAVETGLISDPDRLSHIPTWARPGWGCGVDDYLGTDHYIVPLLSDMKKWNSDAAIHGQEMVFGMSWITKVSYVLKHDGDTSADNSPLIEKLDLDEGEMNDEEE